MVYILFVIGFVLLVKGADWLVDGATAIARRLKVSDLVIGLTIVAFGTSMPELFVNLIASYQGNTAIAIGNILGSNIANILLILGISAIVYPLVVQSTTVWKEIPMSLLAAAMVAILGNDLLLDGEASSLLTRIDGLVLIAFFIIFLYYTFGIAKTTDYHLEKEDGKQLSLPRSILYIVAGLVCLMLGGKWIVDGAIVIAQWFGLSESLIGLTIVAVGTSLPELVTSVVAAMKKNSDIAIGNVVGSNIFNIFWILGVSAIIRPLPLTRTNNIDIIMVVAATVLLWLFLSFNTKKHLLQKSEHVLNKWHGVAFLLIYIGYIAFLVQQG